MCLVPFYVLYLDLLHCKDIAKAHAWARTKGNPGASFPPFITQPPVKTPQVYCVICLDTGCIPADKRSL